MKLSLMVLLIGCLTQPASAQTVQPIDDAKLPRFEVASVKPSDAADDRGMFGAVSPGRFVQQNVNLLNAILMAFSLHGTYQLGPLPDLILGQRFTIDAHMAEGASRADMPLMVRALLIDRFKLRYHIARKQEDGYALAIARRDGRTGPKLRASTVDCAARLTARQPNQALPPLPPGAVECGSRNAAGLINFGSMPISMLVQMLSNQTGREIVDETGLAGKYDVDLRFSADPLRPPRAAADGRPAPDDAPSLFTALQEQLGLKLEPRKVQMERVIIDHIERPDPD
jgi:uncharacterized protein (TIGR03435 family)